jgi:hypothetical protein
MREEVAHNGMGKMAAERHRVGLERPHFGTRFRAQVDRGSLQPNKKLLSVLAARISAKQAKKVGITYFRFAFGTFFSLGCA